ncbi:lytic polysaccharide monooxygenase [Plenodomus tracheiphilus IPT5]|uniref:Lytic polysaccharide monooxygenase n=1 Tax=Plenodomus tracheiphilus IPT5 TaxID=1408161 RepID=A0A6A7AV52_9PLEO|nr:lytic polysaccharide monooxygenase [Plenodomus tracheiphilus IPT5]
MVPNVLIRALGAAAFIVPLASAHMQMLIPSPLRDPNSNRKDEPKDYNILTPLHADGSDFACKGYQWNTPWTSVATYEAGQSYEMTLKGSATHGGGSCQLSLSCDGGIHFKVIKSIVGGCPLEKQYPFTIPPEFARTSKATCLFAWTWFNKIGNREMYMNCAVVDIVPKGTRSQRPPTARSAPSLNGRDVTRANAAAQSLLASYPDLFVANLKNVNSCTVKETIEVVFDNPGRAVSFGNGASGSSLPSFKRGMCTGAGLSSADSSAYSSTSSTGGWKESSSSSGGQDWTWKGGDSSGQSTSNSQGDDGQWHGGSQTSQNGAGNNGKWQPQGQTNSNPQQGACTPGAGAQHGTGASSTTKQQDQTQSNLSPVDLNEMGQQPDANVQSDLDAYLAKLYGKGTSKHKRDVEDVIEQSKEDYEDVHQKDVFAEVESQEQAKIHDHSEREAYNNEDPDESYYKENRDFLYHKDYTHLRRTTRQQRWKSYDQRRDEPSTSINEASVANDATAISEATTENHQGAALVFASSQSKSDAAYYAILEKFNSLGDTVFTLIKFASTYLDGPPPPDKYIFAAVSSPNDTITTLKKRASNDYSAKKSSLRAGLLSKLSSLQNEVFKLLQSAEDKVKTSGGVWNKVKRSFMPLVKRQLIIPGIIPATVQNGEPFYFAAPVASEEPGSEPHHVEHHIAYHDNETDAKVEEIACTFNLSLIDRCMSNQAFLSSIPSDQGKAPTTANLLDALQVCASADAECDGNKKSSREDRLAEMNDNCQGIFMTIGHCLLDDQDTKRVWSTLDIGNLTTLKETPLRASLYKCVQKNVFCASEPTSTLLSNQDQEEASPFNPLVRCDITDLKCQEESNAYAAKLIAEMKQQGQNNTTPTNHTKPHNPLIRCNKDDLGCVAHAKLQELKYPSLNQPRILKRQGDGAQEPGAAEALFPSVSHDSLYDGLEDPSTAQPYDWGSIYPDLGQGGSGRVPAVVGPKPVTGWPSPSEDPVYTGGREPPIVGPTPVSDWSAQDEEDTTPIRLPPVVGPTPVSDWSAVNEEVSSDPPYHGGHDNHTLPVPNVTKPYTPPSQVSNTLLKSPSLTPLDAAVPVPSQTDVPAPYNNDKKNLTLGEALKLAFPELVNHKPIGEPIDQPPRYTQPTEDDSWHDGVFPGLLDARQKSPPPTHTHNSTTPSASSSTKPDANDEDVAALFPYFLGPGPAAPPGVTGDWPSPQQTGHPDNLETMPQVINDLGPEEEAQIRAFFSELAKQAQATASSLSTPTPTTPPGNLETMPQVINDLGPQDEAQIHSFFSSLKNSTPIHSPYQTPTPKPTPSTAPLPQHPHNPRQLPQTPQSSSCLTDRNTLSTLLTSYRTALHTPCNTTPYVQVRGANREQMMRDLARECREERRRISSVITVVERVLDGGCEGVGQFVKGIREGVAGARVGGEVGM